MGTEIRTHWQLFGESEVRNFLERLRQALWRAVTVIVSCREAQARRRIQLYFDDRLIDEFAKAGERIAKRDVND